MKANSRLKNQTSSFTTIEVLVFSGLLATVAALLLPVLEGAHEMSSRASCANNLRQISLAMTVYSGDFRGYFPTGPLAADLNSGNYLNSVVGVAGGGINNWGGFVCYARYLVKKKYIASPAVFVCPSDKVTGNSLSKVSAANSWQTIQWYNLSYFYIVKMTTQTPGKSGTATTNQFYMMLADRANQASVLTPDVTAADNHGTDGRNVAFTDGHVGWIDGVSVTNLYGNIAQDWGEFGVDGPTSPQVVGQSP